MKFYPTVWSISWALNTKVMKISEMKKGMMNRKIKMNNNKHLKLKNQNRKAKTANQQSQENQNLKKSQNARTNETSFVYDANLFVNQTYINHLTFHKLNI